MVARIPLIVNPDAAQIQELPAGDTLDLPVVTLTADGTIADKAAVVLTSAGKAKTISSVGETQIAGTVFHTGSGTEAVYTLHDGAWFGDEGVVVAAWQIKSSTSSLNQRLHIQPGELTNANQISWGTRVNVDELPIDNVALASNGKDIGILMYTIGTAVRVRTITIQNDKTIYLGNSVTVRANTSEGSLCYIGEYLGKSHFAVAYKSSTNESGVTVLNCGGSNNITLGTHVQVEGATTNTHSTTHLIPLTDGQSGSNHKFIVQVGQLNGNVTTHVGSSKGTTIWYIGHGYTPAELGSAADPVYLHNDHKNGSTYDPVNKKYIIWHNKGNDQEGILRVYDVDDTGFRETINFKFATRFVIDGVEHTHHSMYPTVEVTDKGQISLTFNIGSGVNTGLRLVGSYNHEKTNILWGSDIISNIGAVPVWSGENTRYAQQVKADDGKIINLYQNGETDSFNVSGKSCVIQTATTTLTADNFLGFSAGAYSNGDTARIKVSGNTVTGSFTIGKKYYIRDNGAISTDTIEVGRSFNVVAGKAISATTLLITEV